MKADKDLFPCFHQEYQELRENTIFMCDFSIANRFGLPAIQDTFKRAFAEWKSNYKYLTELVIVLNKFCWYFYEQGDMKKSELYSNLYHKAHEYACENLEGDEAKFYFYVTD